MVSAWLGRDAWLPFGHGVIYPNQFVLLLGPPGSRKSTGLNICKSILVQAGYKYFAPERTSLEMYLAGMVPKLDLEEDLETLVLDAPSESFICNGEFLDFIGRGDMDFLTLLTTLWDNLPEYSHPKLQSKSILVHKPTINILGGATVKGLGLAIPAEALGTGVLSRLILVHSNPSGNLIDWPEDVPEGAEDWVVQRLVDIKRIIRGKISKTKEAGKLLGAIYRNNPGIDDSMFADYSSRRYTHLLKLCAIIAIMELRMEINREDVLIANTILYSAEKRMPAALGEFGRSKYSDASNTILNILNHAVKPVTHNKLWKEVAKDLSKQSELGDIMRNLISADKVQIMNINSIQGYMPKHVESKTWDSQFILEGFLTLEEGM